MKPSALPDCLDAYQQCDSIYSFDSTYTDLKSNLLYARWKIRKEETSEAIQILDSILSLSSKENNNEIYQESVFYQLLAKQSLNDLDIAIVDNHLKIDYDEVTTINLLNIKAKALRYEQEVNYSFTTALYSEYLKSLLPLKVQRKTYFLPWSIHAINLIRESNDSTIYKYYLKKSLEKSEYKTPGYRWMKTLSLTASQNLNEKQIQEIEAKVLKGDQYSPRADKMIKTHLNWVSADNFVAINNMLESIDESKPLNDDSNFYNITYLIDAYIDTDNLIEAEKWLDKLLASKQNTIHRRNLMLFRQQKLLYYQYLNTKSISKLNELMNCSKNLMHSISILGNRIINDHYATTIYTSNNILLEVLFELSRISDLPKDEFLNQLNGIKSLYNKVSDSRSVLGNKLPSSSDLKKINQLKHEIEKRELVVNRYQDTTYQDLSIFEELYFLHQELYELKQSLPEVENFTNQNNDNILRLSSIDKETQIIDFIQTDSSIFLSKICSDKIVLKKLDYKKAINSISEKKNQLLDRTSQIKTNYLDSVFIDLISAKHPRIVFIPDGDLFEFPIESIQDKDGHYLNSTFLISYSSQISEAIEKRRSRINDNLFAASYTSDHTLKDRKIKSYPELIFSQNEIEQIANDFSNKEIFSGEEFTEESLTKGLDKDVVHISSHSSSSTENPLDNYILVRDHNGDGTPIYGFTLKSMDWQAKLVVLSSCESGTGAIKPGAGIFSLSRDFLQSGAQTVIKSLWKVNEKSTSELMVLFHQNLRKGSTAIQALQKAKNDLRTQEKYAHPYYWSGFVLEGNPEVYYNSQ